MSEKPSYLDENLDDGEKHGQTRVPSPEEEGEGHGKSAEQPYPGEEGRNDRSFERPDEFGDGDRRS
jgi:hypothetical protein